MSEERDIEKQLRACADERRKQAGAPFEMHPATRRMLQGEVTRLRPATARQAQETKPEGTIAGLWLRVAAGVCTVAILAVGTWAFFRSHEQPQQVAMLATQPELRVLKMAESFDRRATPAENAPAALAMERADGSVTTAIADEGGAAPATVEPAAPAAAPPPASVLLAETKPVDEKPQGTGGIEKDVADERPLLAGAPPASEILAGQNQDSFAPGLPAEVKGEGGNLEKTKWGGRNVVAAKPAYATAALIRRAVQFQSGQVERQIYNFSNAALPAGAAAIQAVFANAPAKAKATGKPTGGNVPLALFQIEQTGDQIRIVDRDGSTYEGVLLAAADDKQAALRQFEVAKSLATAGSGQRREQLPATAVQNVRFACAGTNLSLNQRVVINGEIVGVTNLAENPGRQSAQTDQFKAAVQGGAWLSNGRIIGKAVTTDGREFELNASQIPAP